MEQFRLDWIGWSKEYTFYRSSRDIARLAAFISVFIYFFLLVFRPFFLHSVSHIYALHIAGYALSTFVIVMINYASIRTFWRPITVDWTFGKEFLWNMWNFLTIGLLNFLYAVTSGVLEPAVYDFLYMLFATLSVGIFPVSIIIVMNTLANHSEVEDETSEEDYSSDDEEQKIELELGGRTHFFESDKILAIQSVRNDLIVWNENEGRVIPVMIRGTLKSVEEQLSSHPFILRSHRSYLVNTRRLKSAQLSSNGGSVNIEGLNKSIPVSRSFVPIIHPFVTQTRHSSPISY